MANTLFFALAIPLPAILTFVTLWLSKDALLTMAIVGLLGYIVPVIVYDKWVGDFSFERKLPTELTDYKGKIKLGLILGICTAIATGGIAILWSMFMPAVMGPTSVTLPVPPIESGAFYAYEVFFVLSFLGLAALEHFYFNFFTSIEYTEGEGLSSFKGEKASFGSNFVISLGASLVHFAVFYWTIRPVLAAVIVYTLLAFIMNFICITVRNSKKLIVSIQLRVGFALGILIWIWYLRASLSGNKRVTPDYFFPNNIDNCWNKWFNKPKLI